MFKLNTKIINHIFKYNNLSGNMYMKFKKQMNKTMKIYIKSELNRELIHNFINNVVYYKFDEEFMNYYRLFI